MSILSKEFSVLFDAIILIVPALRRGNDENSQDCGLSLCGVSSYPCLLLTAYRLLPTACCCPCPGNSGCAESP
jgi:hypothetical protein